MAVYTSLNLFILVCFLYWLFLNIRLNSVSKLNVDVSLETKKTTSYLDPPKHMFYYTDGINTHIVRNARLNPEYQLRAYTPKQAAEYIDRNCSLISSSYNVLIPHAYKADLFRYCVLWNEGGVYIDDDIDLEVDLNNLIRQNKGQLLMIQDEAYINWQLFPTIGSRIWQAFLVARTKRNPILECCMLKSSIMITERRTNIGTLELTGPDLITKCLSVPQADAGYVGYLSGGLDKDNLIVHTFSNNPEVIITHHSDVKRNGIRYNKRKWYMY